MMSRVLLVPRRGLGASRGWWPEEYRQLFMEGIRVLELAFPKHQGLPAQLAKRLGVALIPCVRGCPFGFPELGIGLWRVLAPWTVMKMPETSVDENNLAACREDHIRAAGQLAAGQTHPGVVLTQCDGGFVWNSSLQLVSVASNVQEPAHQELGLGVLAVDFCHEFRALLDRHAVHVSILHPSAAHDAAWLKNNWQVSGTMPSTYIVVQALLRSLSGVRQRTAMKRSTASTLSVLRLKTPIGSGGQKPFCRQARRRPPPPAARFSSRNEPSGLRRGRFRAQRFKGAWDVCKCCIDERSPYVSAPGR